MMYVGRKELIKALIAAGGPDLSDAKPTEDPSLIGNILLFLLKPVKSNDWRAPSTSEEGKVMMIKSPDLVDPDHHPDGGYNRSRLR